MSAPAVDERPEVWHRLSPRMLLIHPVIELGRAVPVLLGAFFAGGHNGSGGLWSLVAAGSVLFLSLSRWFTTRLRITPDQVQLRRGLLRRQMFAVPIDRVRTVDVTAHLLHRALGLARVSIGTGTSDRRGRGHLVLDGLEADAAAQLRADLLSGRRPALNREGDPAIAAGPVPTEERQAEYIARLDLRWIRYAPFTLSGAVTALIVYGFGVRIWQDAHINVLRVGPIAAVDRGLRQVSIAAEVAVVVLVVLAFVVIASYLGYLLAFWEFRLTRDDGGTLHIDRGLLTSRATSIERRRLVGVEVSEPLLLRWVGGARTVAIATGLRARRGAERGGEVLLPPAPRTVAVGVAGAVLGNPRPLAAPLIPHGPGARRRRLTRAYLGAVTLTSIVLIARVVGGHGTWLVLAASVSLLVAGPLGVDRYRGLGHALVDGVVVTRFGSLVRRHSAITADGIIGWNVRRTFFQRRLGLASLTATTAAGKQRYVIADVDLSEALRFAELARPGLLTDFLT